MLPRYEHSLCICHLGVVGAQAKWTWQPDDKHVEYDDQTQQILHKSYWSGAAHATDIVVGEDRYIVDFHQAQAWKDDPDADEDSRFVLCRGKYIASG